MAFGHYEVTVPVQVYNDRQEREAGLEEVSLAPVPLRKFLQHTLSLRASGGAVQGKPLLRPATHAFAGRPRVEPAAIRQIRLHLCRRSLD